MFGEKRTSEYAKEGTLAHELAELYIRHDILEDISDNAFDSRLEELMSNDLFNEEMLNVLPTYTGYCEDQFIEAKEHNPLAVLEIEQKLDLTEYVLESFGTADCVIINDDLMEVIDLKYGKGVPVYAEWNKQLMLYALGALRKYDAMYDITEVRVTIVQPRIDNISSWQISVEELTHWAETELKPAAKKAYNGEGELNPGGWCQFCAVKNRCRKLCEQQMEIAKYEFTDPELLTDDEIADVVTRTPKLIEWANSISAYALKQAVDSGKEWPGLKVVEGRSMRKWVDEDTAIKALFGRIPGLTEDDIFNMKLKSLTDIEKLVGKKKFSEMFSDVVIKPQGKPTLVSAEDPRPAMGYEQAKLDFKDE